MDSFDSYYNNMNKPEGKELKLEQEELFRFGSSKITMILLIILWVLLIYPFISPIIFANVDVLQFIDLDSLPYNVTIDTDAGNTGSGWFQTVIDIILSVIIPIGFYLIYTGSKSKDKHKLAKGFQYNKVYFQIHKILLIIAAVFVGIMVLMLLIAAPFFAIVFLLIFGGIFYVLFKIYNMFIEFYTNLSLVAVGKFKPVPLALNIRKVFIVLLVLNVIGLVTFFSTLAIVSSNPAYFPQIAEFVDIRGLLSEIAVSMTISTIISLGSSIYYIYFIDNYNKHFNEFNRFSREYEERLEAELE